MRSPYKLDNGNERRTRQIQIGAIVPDNDSSVRSTPWATLVRAEEDVAGNRRR